MGKKGEKAKKKQGLLRKKKTIKKGGDRLKEESGLSVRKGKKRGKQKMPNLTDDIHAERASEVAREDPEIRKTFP